MTDTHGAELTLPKMRKVDRQFDVAPRADVPGELEREWIRIKDDITLPTDASVAIGVGSRGVSNLRTVVEGVVARLKAAGYRPFILPAMGSHGL